MRAEDVGGKLMAMPMLLLNNVHCTTSLHGKAIIIPVSMIHLYTANIYICVLCTVYTSIVATVSFEPAKL